ncbi:MAG: ABC transporter ATP-binding protein, partial [bacterium]|nr:ABC transporter ATP-binding protein [bacterium]
MIKANQIVDKKISELLETYPFLTTYIEENTLDISQKEEMTLNEFFNSFDEEEIEDRALDKDKTVSSMAEFINQMVAFLG